MMGHMKLHEISTSDLRRILRATEKDAGADSMEAGVLRRELIRREQRIREKRLRSRKGARK
jgi:hypothetical protein